jgi:DNA-binding transcriptional LysR family regulator
MTLRQLEMFVAIEEARSFSKAADKLHVAQPSVSQQIRALEEELGERLLVRLRNRKMYVTEAGKTLRRHADHILRQVEILRMEISALTKEPAGEIRMGIGGHQLLWMLTPALGRFKLKFPKIRVDLVNSTTPQIIELLKSSTLDLGVVTFPVESDKIRTELLYSEEMVVAVQKSHPLAKRRLITTDEIGRLPLVLYDQSTRTRARLDEFFRQEKISPQIVFELSSVEAMQMLVEAGLGATIVPLSSAIGGSLRRSLKYLMIDGSPLVRDVGVTMSQYSRLPTVTNALLELIRNRFQEIASKLPSGPPMGKS